MIIDFQVSLKRIQVYLLTDEINETIFLKNKEIGETNSVELKNDAYFYWSQGRNAKDDGKAGKKGGKKGGNNKDKKNKGSDNFQKISDDKGKDEKKEKKS